LSAPSFSEPWPARFPGDGEDVFDKIIGHIQLGKDVQISGHFEQGLYGIFLHLDEGFFHLIHRLVVFVLSAPSPAPWRPSSSDSAREFLDLLLGLLHGIHQGVVLGAFFLELDLIEHRLKRLESGQRVFFQRNCGARLVLVEALRRHHHVAADFRFPGTRDDFVDRVRKARIGLERLRASSLAELRKAAMSLPTCPGNPPATTLSSLLFFFYLVCRVVTFALPVLYDAIRDAL